MGLLSYFKRTVSRPGAAPRSGLSDEAILAARTKARQRLIGAAVLVVLGVVTLPLLFDTEPRPLPATAAIEMASQPLREAVRPSVSREIEEVAADAGQEVPAIPPTRVLPPTVAPRASGVPGVASAPLAPASAMVMPESVDATGGGARERRAQEEAMRRDKEQRERVERDKARVERERAAEKTAEKARHDKEAREQAQRAAKDKAAKAASEARARDLMAVQKPSGTTTSSTKERFVVQIGAFADQNAATQARARVDKLGVKTYTQVTDTAAGTRIRVRVGPFQDRADAEKTLSKLKASGVSGVVLTL